MNVNYPPNISLSSKIGNNELLCDLKSENKSKTDSNLLRSSSSKASSRLSSNSLTSSYTCGTYVFVIKKRLRVEQAKLLAFQGREFSKHRLKLLTKSIKFEKGKTFIRSISAEGETQHNETVFCSSSRTPFKSTKSLNNKIVDSLFLYGKKKKSKAELFEKFLEPLPKPTNSDTSKLLKPLLQTKPENI